MRKAEINRKFDEIIAFSEIERFLDTPVKRYSSGMYVRLAFAVAAHLEPEILLIDEVLAVGDVAFQKKCLGKMGDVASQGRTVLFVSHNMGAIQQLCPQTILLENGQIIQKEATPEVIEGYLSSVTPMGASPDYQTKQQRSQEILQFQNYWIANSKGKKTNVLKYKEPFSVHLEIISQENISDLAIQIGINSSSGTRIFTSDSEEFGGIFNITNSYPLCLNINFNEISLMPGQYILSKLMIRKGKHEMSTILDILSFEITQQPMNSKMPPMVNTGLVIGKSSWEEY